MNDSVCLVDILTCIHSLCYLASLPACPMRISRRRERREVGPWSESERDGFREAEH